MIGIGGFVGFVGVGLGGRLPRRRHPRAHAARSARFIIYVPIVGGVVLGVSVLMSQIGSAAGRQRLPGGPRTVAGARPTPRTA